MIDKLREIIIHFESLETQMLDPDLMNDQTRYTEVAKEHRRLAPIVEKSKVYIATQEQIDDDNEILAGDDEELKDIAQAEIEELQADLEKQEEELKLLLIPHDPTDDKNTILEIRAGTGGDEAALFAADLFRMYSRFAERNGLKYEVMESNAIGIGGFKEIIFSVKGESVYGLLKFESGVHRVQRVPKTETSGRVHTSAATVAVLPEAEEADVEVVDADLKIDTYRASGAGGQHVNKTESAIRITHIPTGLVVTCQDETSQHKNKAQAMKVLKSRLYQLELEKEREAVKELEGEKKDIGWGSQIRSYVFHPYTMVKDHRTKEETGNAQSVMDGDLDKFMRTFLMGEVSAHQEALTE